MNHNVFSNDDVLGILKDTAEALEKKGFHCIIDPLNLAQGLSLSLHVATSIETVVATQTALVLGAAHSLSSELSEEFALTVARGVAELEQDNATHGG